MIIEIPDDNSIVKWKYNDKDEWKVAEISDLIKAYERPQGRWIVTAEDNDGVHRICCPFCSYEKGSDNTDPIIVTFTNFPKFCENCGADMRGKEE